MLATISRGRPASQLALANELGVDRTVMTYLLDELEKAGLLERRPDPADRRARQVIITPAGSKALIEYRGRLSAAEHQLLAPLNDQESQLFRSFVERIARAAQSSSAQLPGADPCAGEPLTDVNL